VENKFGTEPCLEFSIALLLTPGTSYGSGIWVRGWEIAGDDIEYEETTGWLTIGARIWVGAVEKNVGWASGMEEDTRGTEIGKREDCCWSDGGIVGTDGICDCSVQLL